jgi:hypothetical protein
MSRLSNKLRSGPWRALCLAVCASAPFVSSAQAQTATPDIVVLRSDLTDSQLSAVIDGELASALVEFAHITNSYFSPTPYGDIELAAGCSARTDECVQRVAARLNADRVLVRELRLDATGALVLTLVAKDEGAEGTRRAEAQISARGKAGPERVVPQLVAQVYGAPGAGEPVAGTSDSEHSTMRVAGFTALSTSLAVLASAAGVGIASKRSHDRYTSAKVVDAQSAERADAWLAQAERRARTANALFGVSAGAATTGVILLLWDRFKDSEDSRGVTFDVQAAERSGFVRISGPLGGFR